MVETECFRELNVFGIDECPTPDLLITAQPVVEKPGCFPFRRKVRIFDFFLSGQLETGKYNLQKKLSARSQPVPIPDHLLTSQSVSVTEVAS